jgi:tripartite-type tricarboxylate transporter receptor subunit TctC
MELVRRSGRRAYRRPTAAVALALVLTACSGDPAEKDSAKESAEGSGEESYYAGSTLDLVVPYEPGGGYDTYARALAPYLSECLDAKVVVKNEPGAGGLLATNNTFSTSPDERRLQIVNSVGAVSSQIAGAEGVQFDMTEFSSVGRIAASPSVVAVAADSDVQDFQELIDSKEPLRFPSTGPGANDFTTPNILAEIYGFETKMITGYQGSGEARLALISGDGDAYAQSWDSMLGSIQAGEVRPLLVASDQPVDELPDVPTLSDYDPVTDNGEQIREGLAALEATGRGLVAPPGLPEDRLAELREAFTCTFETQELLDELEGQERPVAVLPGEEWQERVDTALNSGDEFTNLIKEFF